MDRLLTPPKSISAMPLHPAPLSPSPATSPHCTMSALDWSSLAGCRKHRFSLTTLLLIAVPHFEPQGPAPHSLRALPHQPCLSCVHLSQSTFILFLPGGCILPPAPGGGEASPTHLDASLFQRSEAQDQGAGMLKVQREPSSWPADGSLQPDSSYKVTNPREFGPHSYDLV